VLSTNSLFLTQLALPVYKNDVYLAQYGTSAFAADVITRYLFSAAMLLFTIQIINGLGFD